MNITDYHAKFIACEMTRRQGAGGAERLAGAFASAQVDLNPHQVDAALFAFGSPLSKGALLADEVGLGKTIEAGLVIAQRWAENRRRILIITPSNLRKQWHQELSEKFFLPCQILEARSFDATLKSGVTDPFEPDNSIVICSYQFARNKADEVGRTPWDLVVIDEAHRLRNVYKPSNIVANTLKEALASRTKLLLTATPLQNSLLELYGLMSFIDEHAFGDLKSFREQFLGSAQERALPLLRERLRPFCHRTLRRQVTAYVPYTRRFAMVEEFTPAASEDRLYALVSGYLQRDTLRALPAGQRALTTLVLRKLLASSTFAITGALEAMARRLRASLTAGVADAERLADDYEALEATAEEWGDEDAEPVSQADRKAVAEEAAELESYAALAASIEQNAKGEALLKALAIAFEKAKELGAERKAIIFTESRRTQAYLLRRLAESPYAEGVVLFNGSNTDPGSRQIYQTWLELHRGSDRVTGSKTADMRSALVDYFKTEGRIMIATEAGAEGINLQFCSLVVNYDLPWNPQRIEQRIGRCHRYGQKHDVVVVNFLNRKNEADKRVHELLSEKFKLFEGVFGASDEVLGAIEAGVDFEKRIANIYQQCRQPAEIKVAFDQLQKELSAEINAAMTQTQVKLLENFDDEVREKLKTTNDAAVSSRDRFERALINVTRHELAEFATWQGEDAFRLNVQPNWIKGNIPLGLYELPRRTGEAHLYRLNHALGAAVVARASSRVLPPAEVTFDLSGHEGMISALKPFSGQSGWLTAERLTVEALGQTEDRVLLTGISNAGQPLDDMALLRLWTVGGKVGELATIPNSVSDVLRDALALKTKTVREEIGLRNARFFEDEAIKLDGWADDLKIGLEREIKEIDRQIKDARRAAIGAVTLEDKLDGQKTIKSLEATRSAKRRSLFEAQDNIDAHRAGLIADIEGRMEQKVKSEPLFTVRWHVA
ncbi:adenine-specific DNA-methyltransferase [Sphingomonas sp. PP-CE-3G-477]|uniref:DEAD/DEAH box helicase n=1 Tax=Sphingomonas sp. PP-CE-3G-477 TaxID=2135660 RepID=UPI000D471482|nr:DEAD/DEAH box helicase [Sphingomonas sp. PP-CE-3G-477]PTQ59141.1 adenine-specific DNA-methyltransferase [Sphingomonas sp. PP-CE-3G-477]